MDVRKKHIWYWAGGGSPQESFYLYHDAFAITKRDSGFSTSNIASQVFPLITFEDNNYYYIYLGAESDLTDDIDRTFLKRKSKSDGLHINKGWSWYDNNSDGEPDIIIGSGAVNNEKGTTVNVRCATTDNITLSGEQTINTTIGGSKAVVTGDRVLVKNQANQTENGIYVVSTGAWTRATDADSSIELTDLIVYATEGAVTGSPYWYQITSNPTIGVDNIIFQQYNWNIKQNFIGSIFPKDGGGYLALYAANGPELSSFYSLGVVESNDLLNWTRTSVDPIIQGASNLNMLHPRGIRIGNTLHVFINNAAASERTNGHIYTIDHYTTTWNDDPSLWNLTKVGDNLLDAILPNQLGYMSELWEENGVYNFMTGDDTPSIAYNADDGTRTIQIVPRKVVQVRTSDFVNFTVVKTLFDDTQLINLGVNAFCKLNNHNGYKWAPVIGYKWRGQSLLATAIEPFTNGKILTTEPPEDSEIVNTEFEVFPSYFTSGGKIFRTDQPQEASLSPIEAITKTPLTIVNSPARYGYASITPASDAYVSANGNLITDPKYFAIKILHKYVFSTATFPMLWFGRNSDGSTVFLLEYVNQRFRVTVNGAGGLSKGYTTSGTISSFSSAVDEDGFKAFGFIWANGTLKLCGTYTTDILVGTKSPDNSFTDLDNIGDTLRIGAGQPTTSFNIHGNQNVFVLNGVGNATEANWLNCDVI